MSFWDEFQGINTAYLLGIYERYLDDPESVDADTRSLFDRWGPPDGSGPAPGAELTGEPLTSVNQAVGVANLAQAVRNYGHLAAQLDPLGSEPPGDPSLSPDFHGLSEDDLRRLPAGLVGGSLLAADGQPLTSAFEAIDALRRIYSGKLGFDFNHISNPQERSWFQEVVETGRFRPPRDLINPRALLERLTQVETFEVFLHRTFPGKTRFSIEGLDMMVPVLDELIGEAVEESICMFFLGMAHRGRLNVLRHIQQKDFASILAEFKDPGINFTVRDELGWTGDVKYHKGAQRAVESDEVVELVVCMPANPSHLEHVNPVVEGMARAAGTRMDKRGAAIFYHKASVPILIHGDASFVGQGVVAETLNLANIPGYQTGGTIHIIANNQLGYTATTKEARSSLYASDLAKGFKVPIIYANADDPLACIEAARVAFSYRMRFQKDVLIDLIGYRRYGHNEGDEPSFTQPLMYDRIRQHPSVRQIWAEHLIEQGEIEADLADTLVQDEMAVLQEVYQQLQPEEVLSDDLPEVPQRGAARQVKTALPVERLRELNHALLDLPEGFQMNRKLVRGRERRLKVFDDYSEAASIDWATAEELAFATILADGTPIRLTGEDAIRGTFSQRHAVFYDVESGRAHTPLQKLPQARAAFEVFNTPVTENAIIGFEYGYNLMASDRLVIWEAQYGDFINAAQAMIDEFIVSARSKWGSRPSLVLLLPHGNEGQGPDHSSARPERFLQMVADNNLRIANPTTAAQYFHLLRRQAALLKKDPLPLVVLTPKGLLRHPLVSSRPADFAELSWRPVIDDGSPAGNGKTDPAQVRRLALLSGRVFADLMAYEGREQAGNLATARLEQLAPFPEAALGSVLERYSNLEEVIWVQEEPRNMGAWNYIQPHLETLLAGRLPLTYLGRQPSASPAEGSLSWYHVNQQTLVEQLYCPSEEFTGHGVLIERG